MSNRPVSPRFRVLTALAVAAALPAAAWAVGMPAGAADGGPASRADVVALAVYVLLALVVSFLCSVAEAVLLSLTPSYIEGLAEPRPGLAARLRRLKVDNVDRSLAAILTLNTIAHTVGAIGSGAKAVAVFGNAYFGIFSAVMTLLILFLSEIVPKTIGAVFWRGLAAPTAWFVQLLIWALYPLILVAEMLTRRIARGRSVHAFSRDEMAAMANLGERSGALRPDESRIIRNLMMFERLTAADIMTPRPVIKALPETMTVAQAMERSDLTPFSRLPVYRNSVDQVTGFVLKDEILLEHARGAVDKPLTDLRRDIPTTPRGTHLRRLLAMLLEERQAHIMLVVDEYGGTAGLVTMEDVVETLLGLEIVDEMDHEVDMQELARRRWGERAARLGIRLDDGEDAPPPEGSS